jgi:hypothetical protein
MIDFAAGETVFFVDVGGRREVGYPVTVTKVGRKWAHLSNGAKVDLEEGDVEYGGYSGYEVYASEEAWRDEDRKREVCRLIGLAVAGYGRNVEADLPAVLQAAALLGVEVENSTAEDPIR